MTDKMNDIDVDAFADMVDGDEIQNDFESDTVSQPEHTQEESEPLVSITAKEEPVAEDPTYKLLQQNAILAKELEAVRAAKLEAEKVALQSALRGFENQIDGATSNIDRLSDELARARDDGDTARSIKIENAIREQYERVSELKGQINQYSPLLNNYSTPKASPQYQETTKGLDLAQEWIQENATWLKDPSQKDKMIYAERLFKEMQRSGDMAKLGFWTQLDKELTKYENSKHNRMPKNMVAYNNNSSNTANAKKQGIDRDLIRKVAYISKELAGHDDIVNNKPLFNSLLKHYKKVHDEGKLNIPVKL